MDQQSQEHTELRQSVEQLRTEIDALSDTGDPGSKVRLRTLLAELEHKLAYPDDAEHHATVVENLQTAIEDFEVQHPTATGVMNRVMLALSGMGI